MSDHDKINSTPLDDAEYQVKRAFATLYEALVLAESLGLGKDQEHGCTYFGPELSYAMLNLKGITSGSRQYTGK